MKTEEMMVYEAPQVEIIEVGVEKGFAASAEPADFGVAGAVYFYSSCHLADLVAGAAFAQLGNFADPFAAVRFPSQRYFDRPACPDFGFAALDPFGAFDRFDRSGYSERFECFERFGCYRRDRHDGDDVFFYRRPADFAIVPFCF